MNRRKMIVGSGAVALVGLTGMPVFPALPAVPSLDDQTSRDIRAAFGKSPVCNVRIECAPPSGGEAKAYVEFDDGRTITAYGRHASLLLSIAMPAFDARVAALKDPADEA